MKIAYRLHREKFSFSSRFVERASSAFFSRLFLNAKLFVLITRLEFQLHFTTQLMFSRSVYFIIQRRSSAPEKKWHFEPIINDIMKLIMNFDQFRRQADGIQANYCSLTLIIVSPLMANRMFFSCCKETVFFL